MSADNLAQLLARLETSHNDGKIRAALAKVQAVDLDGNALPTYVYRLICGHLVSVVAYPLDERRTLSLYCERDGCGRHRDIVLRML